MAWTVAATDNNGFFTLAETVPFVFPKLLIWGTDGQPDLGFQGRSVEIVGIRAMLGSTHTAGTRTLKLIGKNADGSVFFSTSAGAGPNADVLIAYEFSHLGVAGAAILNEVRTDRLPLGLILCPGQQLLFTNDTATANEVNTVTANASAATTGTFTLTVNGQTTAPIAFNADAAAIYAALVALSNVNPGDVYVVFTTAGQNLGVNSAAAKITWAGGLGARDITITANFAGLSGGGGPHVLATATAGLPAGSADGAVDPLDTLILSVRGRVVR